MTKFVLREIRDYICIADSLPEHNALMPLDLVSQTGEVVLRGRFQLLRDTETRIGTHTVPVFIVDTNWGGVPAGVVPLIGAESNRRNKRS